MHHESSLIRMFFACCNSFSRIFAIYIASVLISATAYTTFEKVSFLDGIWWSLVTALTIGYGDIAPVTFGGKIVGILFSHFWIFGIVPMIVANIITKIIADENEFTQDEQDFIKEHVAKNNKSLKEVSNQLIYLQTIIEMQLTAEQKALRNAELEKIRPMSVDAAIQK